jgi:hypothetical protein
MAKTQASTPTALSLHLGLNTVDPDEYSGWSGPLAACEFDARDMAALARSQSMTPTVLLTSAATRKKTLAAIRAAAARLKAGDLFFLTYSGHGGQVTDVNADEPDGQDETWCLFDGQLIDDELYVELSRFAKGVRVLVLSDSCHSGTVTRARVPVVPPGRPQPRAMPPEKAAQVYREHKDFYDSLQRGMAKAQVSTPTRLTDQHAKCDAAVILISGCQDRQTSMDGANNGAFTEQVLKVWNKGGYLGNYRDFHKKVRQLLPKTQQPNLFLIGPTKTFVAQQPFTV